MPRNHGPARILAVTSGKGGVGKTTLAINIARQASLAGLRTLVIDFDIHNKGATSLFLPKVKPTTTSVTSLAAHSHKFDSAVAPEVAQRIEPVELAHDLLLVPATQPGELLDWQTLVAPNDKILGYFSALLQAVAQRLELDIVVIDCYGGVDTLTVAACGVAHATIIVNEPDVITFSGTLLLYAYLEQVYEASARKPHIHFVINRITARHSFRFLQREYEAHLSQLAVTRDVLAYLPYDKVVVDTFGDYPYVTELLPKGLLTKKIELIIAKLWGDQYPQLAIKSSRSARRIYEKTHESVFIDPEWILRTSVTAPLWFIAPGVLLLALTKGLGGSLSYGMIRGVFFLSLGVLAGVILFVAAFEPLQIARWLLRQASYRRHKRKRVRPSATVYNAVLSIAESLRAVLPALGSVAVFGLFLAFIIGVVLSPRPIFRDVSIWPAEVTGFHPGGDYRGLHLASASWISSNASFRDADLRNSSLDLLLGADLRKARLDSADLDEADLSGANLTGATLSSASLRGAAALGAAFDSTVWEGVEFETATNLLEADFQHASFQGATFASLSFQNTNLSGADLRGARFHDVALIGANLFLARLEGAAGLDSEALSYALASKASLSDQQKAAGKAWRPSAGDEAPWMKRDWVSQEQRRRSDIVFRMAEADVRAALSPQVAGRRTDFVELLLIESTPASLQRAAQLLGELRNADPKMLGSNARVGIVKLLQLLDAVLTQNGAVPSAADWCAWRDKNGALDASWSWDVWNRHFPAFQYPAKGNEKLRAIQLSAHGRITGAALCQRYFQPRGPA